MENLGDLRPAPIDRAENFMGLNCPKGEFNGLKLPVSKKFSCELFKLKMLHTVC